VAHDWEQEAFESFFNPEPKPQNKVNERKRGNPRAILMSKHLSAAVKKISRRWKPASIIILKNFKKKIPHFREKYVISFEDFKQA